MVVLWVLGLYICLVPPAAAQECTFPDNVNWVVEESCEISVIRIAPRNLSVIDGAVLTIEGSGELILDMRNFRISVDPDSRIAVEPGGRIRSNQIGPLLVRGTDGGTFGYFLKRVGGPDLDTFNPDQSFHPSSAIKTLYMIEALRQINNGTLNLVTTNLTSCATTITPGGTLSCPNSFSNATASGDGGNCPPPLVANSPASCADLPPILLPLLPIILPFLPPTQNYGLGVGICAMMKVSNNLAANAIQEAVGAGNPQTGWNNMLNNAGNAIGLSGATTFGNRMGCSGPNNVPNNRTTLRDLGLLYEQMATNPAVLFPVTPPVPFIFATLTGISPGTDAYLFMDNHFNEYINPVSGTPIPGNGIAAIVNEQAAEIGLNTSMVTDFNNRVRLVHKAGSNCTGSLGACTPFVGNRRDFATLAGWVSFPINAGANTRDYVYGVFFNNVTANSLGADLRDDAAQMLRPVIRDALEDF